MRGWRWLVLGLVGCGVSGGLPDEDDVDRGNTQWGDEDTGSPFPCNEVGRTVVGLDDESGFGVPVGDILALVDGEDARTIRYDWGGLATVTVTGSVDATNVVRVERDGEGGDTGSRCSDHLEVPVSVRVDTDDTLLAESFTTTAEVHAADEIRAGASINAFVGTYDPQEYLDDDETYEGAGMSVRWGPEGTTGTVSVTYRGDGWVGSGRQMWW